VKLIEVPFEGKRYLMNSLKPSFAKVRSGLRLRSAEKGAGRPGLRHKYH
jgi:hypothetical protein